MVRRGGKFCVEKQDGSKSFGCHPSRKKANSQLSALYANEPKAAEMRLEHLEANTGAHRYENYNGKKYLVVPVLALKQEVIRAVNAKQSEFVPIDSLRAAAMTWNGRPCVVHHPTRDGEQISANSPEVMEERAFGMIFGSHVNGENLGMEAWVDEDRLKDLGEFTMLDDLQNDRPISVSVGAFVRTEPRIGSYKGKQYGAVWRQTTGDHLAFLPRGRGACDLDMGCGTARAAEKERINSMADAFRSARNIPQSERDKMSDSDFAGKGTSFPIKKAGDVEAAARSIGRAGPSNYSTGKLKRNIIRIAKRKGFEAELPEAWKKEEGMKSAAEHRAAGGPGSGPQKGGAGKRAAKASAKAEKASANGDHGAATVAHMQASMAHADAAKAASAKGNRQAADAHERAAAAHNEAADSHQATIGLHQDPTAAHADTKDAARATSRASRFRSAAMGDDHAKAADMAAKAKEDSSDKDHESAAKDHEKAAKLHSDVADKLHEAGDVQGSNAHNDAASAHKEAALAHKDAAESKEKMKTKAAAAKEEDDDEPYDGDEGDEEYDEDRQAADDATHEAASMTSHANKFRSAEGDDDATDEAVELICYKTIETLFDSAMASITAADALNDQNIADETENPTETPEDEDAEEDMEDARLRAILVHTMTAINALYSVQNQCYTELAPEEPGESSRYAAGARHSLADRNMIQEVHDKSVTLGAECPGMKSAASPCGCGGHAAEGANKMTREERIAALAKNEHNPIKDTKALAALSDTVLTSLEGHCAKAAEGVSKLTELEGKVKALESPKEMTTEQFMKAAPAELRSLVDRATKRETERKTALVAELKTAADGVYTEDELKAMPLEALEKAAKLAKVHVVEETDFSGRPMPRAASGKDDVFRNPPNGYEIALEKRRGGGNAAAAK